MALFRKKKKTQRKTPYERYKKTMAVKHPGAVVATEKEFAKIQKRPKGEVPYYAPYKRTPEYREYLREQEEQARRKRLRKKRRKPVKKTKKEFKTVRTKATIKELRKSLSEEDIAKLRGRK